MSYILLLFDAPRYKLLDLSSESTFNANYTVYEEECYFFYVPKNYISKGDPDRPRTK